MVTTVLLGGSGGICAVTSLEASVFGRMCSLNLGIMNDPISRQKTVEGWNMMMRARPTFLSHTNAPFRLNPPFIFSLFEDPLAHGFCSHSADLTRLIIVDDGGDFGCTVDLLMGRKAASMLSIGALINL